MILFQPPSPWPGMPHGRPGYPGPHPTWLWTFPVVRHPQLDWATCSSLELCFPERTGHLTVIVQASLIYLLSTRSDQTKQKQNKQNKNQKPNKQKTPTQTTNKLPKNNKKEKKPRIRSQKKSPPSPMKKQWQYVCYVFTPSYSDLGLQAGSPLWCGFMPTDVIIVFNCWRWLMSLSCCSNCRTPERCQGSLGLLM